LTTETEDGKTSYGIVAVNHTWMGSCRW